jgi:hypothetical protein
MLGGAIGSMIWFRQEDSDPEVVRVNNWCHGDGSPSTADR